MSEVNETAPGRVGLCDELIDALNERGVEYCHWKSNWTLADGLSGAGDLDFFVDRSSLPAALGVLSSLGFKPAVTRRGPQTAGASHHYGLDPQSGKIIHAHIYTMLLTGESAVKSHRLPFEIMLLENRSRVGSIQVTSKSAELVLHILRTFIKYGALADAVRLMRKPESAKEELRWLLAGGDPSEALSLLKRHCPAVDESLFRRCVAEIEEGGSFLRRALLARAVRRRLRIYAGHTWLSRRLAYAHLLLSRARGRLTGMKRNRALLSGGAVVAFVGGDATGKSTLVGETARWLGRTFAVRTVHAGKPPATWLTLPVRLLLLLSRRWLPRGGPARSAVGSPDGGQQRTSSFSFPRAVRAVTLAWERRRLLIRARRHSAGGDIVICDRYPSDTVGAMDSPRLREDPARTGPGAALRNWLARVERGLYAQIPPPDIVVRLTVSLETAQRRNLSRAKPDEQDFLEARHRESATWSRAGTRHICEIDTDGPIGDTMLRVKRAIWPVL